MHKRETTKITLISFAAIIVLVINAFIIVAVNEPEIIDVPETEQAHKPVPDFAQYTQTDEKKRAFFNYLRPEVESQNSYLLTLRHYLQNIQRKHTEGQALTDDETDHLAWLREEYNVKEELALDNALRDLLMKVDILPTELVLVQAANESAWGTSRFARKGYNFYGLWCYKKGCGFVPSRRTEGMKHEVAKFDNVSRATYTYMRNLNRNQAYSKLRTIRANLRANQREITGVALAEGLMSYSERGVAYIEELQAMIRHNQEYISE